MRVGWIGDAPGYLGGAEMTQAELIEAAPVEVTTCLAGEIDYGCDLYVANNVIQYSRAEFEALPAPVVWMHHDLSPWIDAEVREWLDRRAVHIFVSPMQADLYATKLLTIDHPSIWHLCPPALDLTSFEATGRNRAGACSIGQWRNPGKGGGRLAEWAARNEPVDIYGVGQFVPKRGPNVQYRGPLNPEEVAAKLSGYETFVFLPTEPEPFSRTTVEAWAAGCKLVVNRNIGALHWIEHDRQGLEGAAERFWKIIEMAA